MTSCPDVNGASTTRIKSNNFTIQCDAGREGVDNQDVYTCDRGVWRLNKQTTEPNCTEIAPTMSSLSPLTTEIIVTTDDTIPGSVFRYLKKTMFELQATIPHIQVSDSFEQYNTIRSCITIVHNKKTT